VNDDDQNGGNVFDSDVDGSDDEGTAGSGDTWDIGGTNNPGGCSDNGLFDNGFANACHQSVPYLHGHPDKPVCYDAFYVCTAADYSSPTMDRPG
jgi:hypothetical protein